MISPIALFVYNRPWHTEQALIALSGNDLADQSILYVFSDGPKIDADKEMKFRIDETRRIVKSKKWCKQVVIREQKENSGLSKSIIHGVTEVVNNHGSVIVLEDDIVASKGFLKYMNDALTFYSGTDKVSCIHGWNYHLDYTGIENSTFFLKGADCWGWATWEDSWKLFNANGAELLDAITKNKSIYEFNRKGTHEFTKMLKDQIEGKNDSWAIRWHASLFLQNKYCLHPTRPIVKNIGLDNSGTHCGDYTYKQEPVDFIEVKKIPIKESDWFYNAYSELEGGKSISNKPVKWFLLKKYIRRLLSPKLLLLAFVSEVITINKW
jgi:hypothetical protein